MEIYVLIYNEQCHAVSIYLKYFRTKFQTSPLISVQMNYQFSSFRSGLCVSVSDAIFTCKKIFHTIR